MVKNSEISGIIAGITLFILGVLMLIVPTLINADMMQWGFGVGFMGLFILIIGIVVFFMYYYRYSVMKSLLAEENLLAHWTYDRDDYEKQVQKEFVERKQLHRSLLAIVIFFFVVFTTIFLIFGFDSSDTEEILTFLTIMLGSLAIITLAALSSPYFMRRKALSVDSDTYISTKGFYYNGYLHTWNKPLAKINNLYVENDSLVFVLAYLTKLGWIKYEEYTVRIPIPKGREDTANEIVAKLGF